MLAGAVWQCWQARARPVRVCLSAARLSCVGGQYGPKPFLPSTRWDPMPYISMLVTSNLLPVALKELSVLFIVSRAIDSDSNPPGYPRSTPAHSRGEGHGAARPGNTEPKAQCSSALRGFSSPRAPRAPAALPTLVGSCTGNMRGGTSHDLSWDT